MKCARGFSSRYVDQAQKRTHPLQETCLPPRRRRGEKSRAIDKAKGRRVKREREERGRGEETVVASRRGARHLELSVAVLWLLSVFEWRKGEEEGRKEGHHDRRALK